MHSEFVISVQAAARVEINHDRTLLNLNSEALYREMLKWLLFFPRNTGWFQSFIWKKMTIFIPKSKISRFFGINFGICASENIVFNFLEKTLKATILKMMILIALILVQVFLHLSNRRFKFFSFMPKLMTHFYD